MFRSWFIIVILSSRRLVCFQICLWDPFHPIDLDLDVSTGGLGVGDFVYGFFVHLKEESLKNREYIQDSWYQFLKCQ